jgi:Ca2+/Na+ antiporter
MSTFAATITYTTILSPRSVSTRGISELAYANSLFFGVMMGCVLIIASIETNDFLNKTTHGENKGLPRWVILTEFGLVSTTLFVAFYLMLHASMLFLQYNGPFILGSCLYLICGVLVFVLWIYSLLLSPKRGKEVVKERSPATTPAAEATPDEESGVWESNMEVKGNHKASVCENC